MKGLGSAFKGFGLGAVGGLISLIGYSIFGPLGFLAGPLLAGSMIKGDRGEIISVVSGFMLLLMGGMFTGASGSSNEGVM